MEFEHDYIYSELQCGRIYKDAEIDTDSIKVINVEKASMWPHL